MPHYRMTILEETGYVVLDPYGGVMDPAEWQSLEYVDWKSSGDTRFAPIASAHGEIECNGFWHANPPKPDKDGVWIPSQVAKAPTLAARVGRLRLSDRPRRGWAHRRAYDVDDVRVRAWHRHSVGRRMSPGHLCARLRRLR